MEIVVGIVPYHRRLANAINEHYDDVVQGANVSNVMRRTDIYTIMTIIMKVSVVDYMSDIASMASESIYRHLNLKYSVSMLMISHMVNEIIESDEYIEIRHRINQCVARTSDRHLGVNDVILTWNLSKVVIHVAGRRGEYESNSSHS